MGVCAPRARASRRKAARAPFLIGDPMRSSLSAILLRLRRFARQLWVRSVLIGALALVAAGASRLVYPVVPSSMGGIVGAEAVDHLLQIIADSMLAVTIFSLTIVVSIHRSTSSQWSPRAHRLIVSDDATMTVLSTFVGTWIFSLAAIVLREAGLIDGNGLVVLFGLTLLVLALIVASLIRWIARLEDLGSLAQVGGRLEQEARDAMQRRMALPCLGGRPLLDASVAPVAAHPVRAAQTGWVMSVDAEGLHRLASEHEVELRIEVPIGRFAYEGETLASIHPPRPDLEPDVQRGFEIGQLRTYEQDPRFGMVVLGEVACKALSSGINDPGTAIEIVGRAARVLWLWRDEAMAAGDPPYPRLQVAPLDPRDLVEDVFVPIARDGRDKAEVQIHLQQALGSLARHPDPTMARAARDAAEGAWRVAQEALDETDLARVAHAAGRASAASALRNEPARREA